MHCRTLENISIELPLDFAGKHKKLLHPLLPVGAHNYRDILIIFDEQRRHGKGIAKVISIQISRFASVFSDFGGGIFFFWEVILMEGICQICRYFGIFPGLMYFRV